MQRSAAAAAAEEKAFYDYLAEETNRPFNVNLRVHFHLFDYHYQICSQWVNDGSDPAG